MRNRDQIIDALEDLLAELQERLISFQKEAGEDDPPAGLPSSYSVCFHYRREIEKVRKALSDLG
mgnify:FL=1|tara:strand:+ start:596 stop:787 length:192 start_codon:yes stop_codon:yes gene_type:complete